MENKKNLYIISNEKISKINGEYFCDNLDMKSTSEGLDQEYDVHIIARYSKTDRSHRIKIKNIKISKTLPDFLKNVCNFNKLKKNKFLIISITPYTFLANVILRLLGNKPFVYLRSDGYGEYKSILGFLGPIFYHFMFEITAKISNFISCREHILRGNKGKVIYPSQLNSTWFLDIKTINIKETKLLYVGRVKKEKGIFSLVNLLKDKKDVSLTIVGEEKNQKNIIQENVKVYEIEDDTKNLIKFYDDHNIFVLPSFTEGHPMVVLESLARLRPVIIFEDIEHIIENKKGIFVSKRDKESFFKKIEYIKNNINKIQEEMKKNKLPKNEEFIRDLARSISNLN